MTLEGRLETSSDATLLHLHIRTPWSEYWPPLLNVAVLFGGALAGSAICGLPRQREFGLDVLVPLFSGIFTILVIFVPAFWFMVARRAPGQSRWLIA